MPNMRNFREYAWVIPLTLIILLWLKPSVQYWIIDNLTPGCNISPYQSFVPPCMIMRVVILFIFLFLSLVFTTVWALWFKKTK